MHMHARSLSTTSTIVLAYVDLIRGAQKQRVNNKINLNRKNNPISHNFRKHFKFISETLKYAFSTSFTYFECQVLEIILQILKKTRKSDPEILLLEVSTIQYIVQYNNNILQYIVSRTTKNFSFLLKQIKPNMLMNN